MQAAYSDDLWYGALKTLAILWELQGSIWHGKGIDGMEFGNLRVVFQVMKWKDWNIFLLVDQC